MLMTAIVPSGNVELVKLACCVSRFGRGWLYASAFAGDASARLRPSNFRPRGTGLCVGVGLFRGFSCVPFVVCGRAFGFCG